ncbi:MAG: HD domain-containing protein [Desulfobacterales bacterium]|nr:HD domain-containing protein [Desulfobacterales bacterium]MCP4163609.1 HD domain-containing protein [Deltaproteobacteria bacterium]
MKNQMGYNEAVSILDKYVQTPHIKLHSRESEVIMRKVAKHFGEDEDLWGITGLLHDLDMDVINGDYNNHGTKTIELLKEEGYEIPEMFNAIIAHTEVLETSNAKRETRFDYVLSGAENLTGIISAYVAVRPGKKIEGAKQKSVVKKLKDKSFAAAVNRSFINDVTEKAGLERSQFIQMGIDAMCEISEELGM